MATYQIVDNIKTTQTAGYAFSPDVPDFADFKQLSNVAGETIVGCVASPLGLPNTFKFGCRQIDNIYRNTKIDPGLYPPVKSGISAVFQTNETWSMVDPTDASVPTFALPVEAHCVLRLPNNELITSAMIVSLLERMMGSVLDTKLSNLAALIRGGTNMLP